MYVMKKLFIWSLFLLGLVITSCSSEDFGGDVTNVLDNNVKLYGTKSSQVSVYAGSIQLSTRGCDVNGNMWPSLPAAISDTEVSEVLAYIATNPEGLQWPGYTYYYVQHVGGANHEYSYTDWNGALHTGINGTSGMEQLQIKENNGYWIHVNNFNAGKCDNAATGNSALMTDGFIAAKTIAEFSSSEVEQYKIFYFKGAWYIGFDFSANKGDGSVPADGIYDDWVVKIIPAAGETPVDPTDDPEDDPTPDPEETKKGEVEFDVHQQEHKDWNEIKTSIHLRDTVDVRLFIPIPKAYQAVADDFDIRAGIDYTRIDEVVEVKYVVAGEEFSINVEINHSDAGIEILIAGKDCAEALKHARGVYDDGITFEIHSYVYPTVEPAIIWSWLKNIECAQTSLTDWPASGDCVTHTYGQVTSAYYPEEGIRFDKYPE